MSVELKLRKIGNSIGATFPKEVLSKLKVAEGESLYLTEGADGAFRLTRGDGDFARQMEVAEDIIRRYRNALRELAK